MASWNNKYNIDDQILVEYRDAEGDLVSGNAVISRVLERSKSYGILRLYKYDDLLATGDFSERDLKKLHFGRSDIAISHSELIRPHKAVVRKTSKQLIPRFDYNDEEGTLERSGDDDDDDTEFPPKKRQKQQQEEEEEEADDSESEYSSEASEADSTGEDEELSQSESDTEVSDNESDTQQSSSRRPVTTRTAGRASQGISGRIPKSVPNEEEYDLQETRQCRFDNYDSGYSTTTMNAFLDAAWWRKSNYGDRRLRSMVDSLLEYGECGSIQSQARRNQLKYYFFDQKTDEPMDDRPVTLVQLSTPFKFAKCEACAIPRSLTYRFEELQMNVGSECARKLLLLGKIVRLMALLRHFPISERFLRYAWLQLCKYDTERGQLLEQITQKYSNK